MTDQPQVGGATASADTWLADYLAREAALSAKADQLRPTNKLALFGVLAAAGIVNVTVQFDGYGDSGQIESIDARGAEGDMPLPEAEIEIASPSHNGADVVLDTLQTRDAIEQLCYELLGDTHGGWENNDGAFGEFVFDVAAGTISLDHNDRYTAITSYTHKW